MDALDRLATAASDLLGRVDVVLARSGAPEGHPIWPLLRRVRALPGEAVEALVQVRPGDAGPVRTLAQEYAAVRANLPVEIEWRGAGAESFMTTWMSLAAHLDGGVDQDGLLGRLLATAAYLEMVDDWIRETRDAVARTVAEVLVSVDAVTVQAVVPDPASAGPINAPFPDTEAPSAQTSRAAAEIAATVLATLALAHDRGQEVHTAWLSRVAELPYLAPEQVRRRRDITTEVPL